VPETASSAGALADNTSDKTLSGEHLQAKSPTRRRRIGRLLLLLGPVVVLIAGSYIYFTGGRYVGTDNAYVKADNVTISAQVEGVISAVTVSENQHVESGAELFRIDDRSYQVALDQADAQLAAVTSDIDGLKAQYREKLAEIELAQTNQDFAERELQRQTKLAKNKLVSDVTLDKARHDLDIARQNLAMVRQEKARILTQLNGNPEIAPAQLPRYAEARAKRAEAALNLQRTRITAPFSGIASNVPELGKYVATGAPVMSVVADDHMWIEANFKETDLEHVQPGQPATITIDTYPDHTWQGTVQSISQATGAEFSILPPQNASGNWVKVVQRIPLRIAVQVNNDDPLLRAGMSSNVEIDTGRQRPLPAVIEQPLAWLKNLPFNGTPIAEAATTKVSLSKQ
jgi:membrane fusion protein (multidrug efflux system)